MLAKVIKLTHERRTQSSAQSVMDYLTRDDPADGGARDVTAYAARDQEGLPSNPSVLGGTFNLEGLGISDPADRDLIVKMMDYISRAGQQKTHFNSNPIYHFALSWRAGEYPDQQQVHEAVAHALESLGMQENQAFFVIHRDKAHHHHVHVIVNRVHPEKLTLSGPPRFDFLVLDQACRELELLQGWQHDHGPHAVIDGEIKRLTRAQRKALGMMPSENTGHASTPAARMLEIHSGVTSFAAWAREHVASELTDVLQRPDASWESLHESLAKRGIRMEMRGGGLALVTQGFDRETSTKASGLDCRLSLGRLQKTLGPYQPPTGQTPFDSTMTYARHIESVMTGKEPGEHPGRTGVNNPERDQRRVERQMARECLLERYKTEKAQAKDTAKVARASLRRRQAEEKVRLRHALKAAKPERIVELTKQLGSRQMANGIWAAEKAIKLDVQRTDHNNARAELSRTLNMNWPAWLERQAAAGDDAAKAALRGIRYREQRKRAKGRPGFEGEDLSNTMIQPRQAGGSIAGKVGPFRLSSTGIDIDYRWQRIVYKDADGKMRLIDSGPRIDVVERDDPEAIREGLILAAQKFGGEVYITGDAEFRERAAHEAARMHIRVADQNLQHVVQQELAKIKQHSNTNGLTR